MKNNIGVVEWKFRVQDRLEHTRKNYIRKHDSLTLRTIRSCYIGTNRTTKLNPRYQTAMNTYGTRQARHWRPSLCHNAPLALLIAS
jgi:hypothetical protein